MSLLGRVVACLESQQIAHALIGGTALAAHGVARSTKDVDLLATSPKALTPDAWKSLTDAGAEVDIRSGDADDPLRGVVRVVSGDETVDVVIGKHAFQQGVLERSKPLPMGTTRVPVVTAADLVLLKLFAGGYQDRWDILQLLSGATGPAIAAEVDSRVRELSPACEELWQSLRTQPS